MLVFHRAWTMAMRREEPSGAWSLRSEGFSPALEASDVRLTYRHAPELRRGLLLTPWYYVYGDSKLNNSVFHVSEIKEEMLLKVGCPQLAVDGGGALLMQGPAYFKTLQHLKSPRVARVQCKRTPCEHITPTMFLTIEDTHVLNRATSPPTIPRLNRCSIVPSRQTPFGTLHRFPRRNKTRRH